MPKLGGKQVRGKEGNEVFTGMGLVEAVNSFSCRDTGP